MVNKLLGIVLSLVGLAVIAVTSVPSLSTYLSFLPASIKMQYVLVAGLCLVIVGVILGFGKGKSKVEQASEEVPIYAGEGRNRKIVGYRRAENK